MNAEGEIHTALAGRAWQPIKPVQFPRNSSFVIICASQVEAYSAGQEELPEHPRSKTDSTLVSRASSIKLTQISPAEHRPPSPGCRRAAAPASSPPCGHPQQGWKPSGKYQWASSERGGSPVKIGGEGAGPLPAGFCSPWSPGQGERLWEAQARGLAGEKRKVPRWLMCLQAAQNPPPCTG